MSDKKYPKLEVRATADQIARWKRLAERQSMTLPKLVRALLDGAAAKAGIT